jgi:DNA repair protein RadC
MPTKKQRLNEIKGDWAYSRISVSFKPAPKDSIEIISDWDAYCVFLSLWDKGLLSLQEQFVAVFLNSRQQVIGWRVLNIRSMETCVIDIRLLLSLALHCLASSVVLAHNHPSGILEPSLNDRAATLKIKQALRLIDVLLLDHLILSADGYFSMSVERLI